MIPHRNGSSWRYPIPKTKLFVFLMLCEFQLIWFITPLLLPGKDNFQLNRFPVVIFTKISTQIWKRHRIKNMSTKKTKINNGIFFLWFKIYFRRYLSLSSVRDIFLLFYKINSNLRCWICHNYFSPFLNTHNATALSNLLNHIWICRSQLIDLECCHSHALLIK